MTVVSKKQLAALSSNPNLMYYTKIKIGSGEYGSIHKYVMYRRKERYCELILKTCGDIYTGLDENQMDKKTIQELKDCGAIHVVQFPEQNVIAMEVFHGDLSTLIKQKTFDAMHAFKIIYYICKILLCMEKKGHYYYDLKLNNILWRCTSKDTVTIALGDIGSAHAPHGVYMIYYPPIEQYADQIVTTEFDDGNLPDNLSKCTVYVLTALFAVMVDPSLSELLDKNRISNMKNSILKTKFDIDLHNADEMRKIRIKYHRELRTLLRDELLRTISNIIETHLPQKLNNVTVHAKQSLLNLFAKGFSTSDKRPNLTTFLDEMETIRSVWETKQIT